MEDIDKPKRHRATKAEMAERKKALAAKPKAKPGRKSNAEKAALLKAQAVKLKLVERGKKVIAESVEQPPKEESIVDVALSEEAEVKKEEQDLAVAGRYDDPEKYLMDVMNDVFAEPDRRDSSAKALLRAKTQRENANKQRQAYGMGKKESLDKEANDIVGGKKTSSWAGVLSH